MVLSLFVFAAPLNTYADTITEGFLTFDTATGTVLRLSPSAKPVDLVIPETIGGITVTAIGSSAFFQCETLRSIVIPDSVTAIGIHAFESCTALESIEIPYGVTDIGEFTFSRCAALKSVILPSSITSVGEFAFSGCQSLSGISIPNVTSVGSYAFRSCMKLPDIALSPNVTAIGEKAFLNCESLTSISIDGSNPYYTSLDGVLFDKAGTKIVGFPGAKSGAYVIPDSVTSLENDTFSTCAGLTSITIPANTSSIAESWIANCASLTAIYVDAGNLHYKSTDGVLFNKAGTALIRIPQAKSGAYIIPSGVASIENSAVARCEKLDAITIPGSVATVAPRAFSNCTALSVLQVDSASSYYKSIDNVLLDKASTTIIYCPESKSGAYIIPNGVTAIANNTLSSCTELTEITIPSSVTTIALNAFYYCKKLSDLHVNESNAAYKSIDGVLFNKAGTTLVCYPQAKNGAYTLPGSVLSIDRNAFLSCAKLTAIVLPDGFTSIGATAFAYCTSLTSVLMPKSMKSIESNAFLDCTALTTVYYRGSLSDWWGIAINAFNNDLGRATTIFNYVDPGKECSLSISWGPYLEDNGMVMGVSITNNNAGEAISGTMLIGVYDKDCLVAVFPVPATVQPNNYFFYTDTFKSPFFSKSCTVKVFLWDDTATAMPLAPTISATPL